jgi:hypothetical protein
LSVFCFNGVNSYFIGQRQTDEEAKNNPRPNTPRTAHCELKVDTHFCEKENESIYLGKRFFLMCNESECYRLDFDQKLGMVLHLSSKVEGGHPS